MSEQVEIRSARLRQAIRDDLHEAAPLLTIPQIEQAVEVAANAAEHWWLSMTLRTKPDFVRALIAADEFDWSNAQPMDVKAYLAQLERRRATACANCGHEGVHAPTENWAGFCFKDGCECPNYAPALPVERAAGTEK